MILPGVRGVGEAGRRLGFFRGCGAPRWRVHKTKTTYRRQGFGRVVRSQSERTLLAANKGIIADSARGHKKQTGR